MKPGEPFNPYRRYPGALIPEPIYKYRGLSPGAKVMYGRLCRYGGEDGKVFPAIATLGEELGIGSTQARQYVHELAAKRFIGIDSESGKVSSYTFLWHDAFEGSTGTVRKAPPLRKTGGVTPSENRRGTPTENRNTTPPENRTQRESVEESRRQESPSEESQPNAGLAVSVETPNAESGLHDDDKPRPDGKRYASERDELIGVIRETTDEQPDAKLIRQITEFLELRGGTLRAYLDDIRPRLGRLRRTPTPAFFYKHAETWGSEGSRPARAAREAELDVARCGCRHGQVQRSDGGWIPCPNCSMGREVAKALANLAKAKQVAV